MKKPIDKPRKRKDTPAVSKKEFIAAYRKAAVQRGVTAEPFSAAHATERVEGVICGFEAPSLLLQEVARAYGAKRGRVGNFLRSLK